ncbi:MAG: hypothetical protein HY912_17150 [Desulfomonile tiedjei]|uniref:Uncharacterized protein n=1 Tax=Desulfomonile tiedjei TaxID=2358 RepID=A0A9D6Z1L8_9BACT|nr:hypothetical protein [Desulfomonile tiedjei]
MVIAVAKNSVPFLVIPAKAGIQSSQQTLDPGFYLKIPLPGYTEGFRGWAFGGLHDERPVGDVQAKAGIQDFSTLLSPASTGVTVRVAWFFTKAPGTCRQIRMTLTTHKELGFLMQTRTARFTFELEFRDTLLRIAPIHSEFKLV